MMLTLAHMTPLLVPTYWAVFAAGIAVGALLGYRLGLRRSAPHSTDSRNPRGKGNSSALSVLKVIKALTITVAVAQLVRAPDCGSGGRGFEPPQPPLTARAHRRLPRWCMRVFFWPSCGLFG